MRGCLLAPLFFLPAWRRPQAPNSWLPGSRVLTLGLRNSDMGPQIYTQGDTPGNGQRWGLLPNSPVTFQGPPKSKDRQSTGERNPGIQRRESPKLRTSTPAPSLSRVGAGSGKQSPHSTEASSHSAKERMNPTGY